MCCHSARILGQLGPNTLMFRYSSRLTCCRNGTGNRQWTKRRACSPSGRKDHHHHGLLTELFKRIITPTAARSLSVEPGCSHWEQQTEQKPSYTTGESLKAPNAPAFTTQHQVKSAQSWSNSIVTASPLFTARCITVPETEQRLGIKLINNSE